MTGSYIKSEQEEVDSSIDSSNIKSKRIEHQKLIETDVIHKEKNLMNVNFVTKTSLRSRI